MTAQETREQKAAALRYKRPALADLGYYSLITGLYEITEEANNALYYIGEDDGSDGGLLATSDGDDELANEFAVAFGDIAAKAEELRGLIDGYDVCVDAQVYDDCTCALIGNRYDMVGYDSMQEDYYALCGYEAELLCDMVRSRIESIIAQGGATFNELSDAFALYYKFEGGGSR